MIRLGNASPPCETKIAGPVNGTGRIGVTPFAKPTVEAAGQLAGFASKTAVAHAFCSVVNLDGNNLGSSTLTLAMFACDPCGACGKLNLVVRLAPFTRLVFPDVETLNVGLNAIAAQLVTWKWYACCEVAPW